MDGRIQGNGSSFFAFIHLLHQKVHSFIGNLINLLSDCADRDDCFPGNRRIVEADQEEIFRESPVSSYEQIHKYIGLCIIGDEQAFFLS